MQSSRVRGKKLSAMQVARARRLRRTETEAEHRLWGLLRNRRMETKFVRQYPIGPYVADFASRSAMLVIEVDGSQHAMSATDVRRTAFLNAHGYSVLRFWNADVLHDLGGCWKSINSALAGHPSPGERFAPATLSPKGRGGLTARTKDD